MTGNKMNNATAEQTATVEYGYLDDSRQRTGSTTARLADMVEAAVKFLDAELLDDGDYIYRAEETGGIYRITGSGMAAAGAAILAGRKDWYSLWCTWAGKEVRQTGTAQAPEEA